MRNKTKIVLGVVASLSMSASWTSMAAADDNTVSVLHYWTAGGEAAALNVARTAFEQNGGVWKDSPVSGGGGDTHDQVLRSNILAGNAPGAAIPKAADAKTWYTNGYVSDLDEVAKKDNWDALIPKAIADAIKVDGHYITAPTNIHRFNSFYANAAILAKNGIGLPKTWDEFNEAAEKLKKAGIVPLAHGGQAWQDSILFETVLVGIGGPDFFRKALVENDEAAIKSDTMLKVFDQFRKLRGDLDPNFSGRDWNIATSMVIKGQAAFQIMGDWAKGEVTAEKVTPDVGVKCGPAPSNFPGAFLYTANSFTFFNNGHGTLTPAQAKLAETLMDPQVQSDFNLAKGSVPVVEGADISRYDSCGRSTAADLKIAEKKDTLLPALNGGMSSSGEMRGAIEDAVTKFFNSEMSSQDGVDLLWKQISTAL